MGRHINSPRTGFQHDFQQVPAGKSQNGPAVRVDISNQFQPPCQRVRRFQIRQEEKAVHLSHPVSFFIDGADFPGDNEAGLTRGRSLQPVFLFEDIQTLFRRFQLFCQFCTPCRMGKIPGPYNIDSFFPGPQIQIFRCAVPAGCPGVSGVDMQIPYVHFFLVFPLENKNMCLCSSCFLVAANCFFAVLPPFVAVTIPPIFQSTLSPSDINSLCD